MSERKITSATEINRELGVSSAGEVRERHIGKFMDIYPRIDRGIAIEYIKQMPAIIQNTSLIAGVFKDLQTEALRSANESNSASMKGHQTAIETYSSLIKDSNSTYEEKLEWSSRIDQHTEAMDRKDSEQKSFISSCIEWGVKGVFGTLILAICGVGIKNHIEKSNVNTDKINM